MKKIFDLFKIELNLSERIFGLDLMRSLAILLVVFIHGDIIVRDAFPHFPEFWIIDGVDLFFVLSGFLIGNILIRNFDKKENSFRIVRTFWKRRWFRTLPNYFLILLLVLLYNYFVYQNFGLFNYKFLIFLQNLNYPHPSFFNIAWSLSIEEWFYVFFPIGIFLLIKLFPGIKLKTILLILVIFFVLFSTFYRMYLTIPFLNSNYAYNIWETYIRKIILTRFDTIMYGVFGAFLSYYYSNFWQNFRYHLFILGIIIILFTHYYLNSGYLKYTFYLNGEGIGIFFTLPLLSSINSTKNWIKIPITYISIISYSVYLIHFSLVLIPLLYLFPTRNQEISITVYSLYYILSFLLSILIYKYYEKPVTNFREKI